MLLEEQALVCIGCCKSYVAVVDVSYATCYDGDGRGLTDNHDNETCSVVMVSFLCLN